MSTDSTTADYPPTPTGRTSNAWYFNGYQAAMRDIADALERGGEDEVREWVRNNTAAIRRAR